MLGQVLDPLDQNIARLLVCIGEQQQKLIPSNTGSNVNYSGTRPQYVRHELKGLVTDVMSMAVIQTLELVDINVQQRIGTAGTLTADQKSARFELHSALKQSNFDYERQQYNTVVSAAMKMLNALETVKRGASPALSREGASVLLRTLYPVAPHITCQLWADLGFDKTEGSLLDAKWPQPDAGALVQDEIKLALQVNGKTRGEIVVPASADKAAIEAAAAAAPDVAKFGEGRTPKKIIVVPGRLVNVVV